jgi:O-antigen ligase
MVKATTVQAFADESVPPRPRRDRTADALAFLVPASFAIQFNVVGVLFVSDVLVMALLPIALSRVTFLFRNRISRRFLLLALLWLAAQIVTDLYLSTDFNDYARGWSRIGLMLATFLLLATVIDGQVHRFGLFMAGYLSASCLRILLLPVAYFKNDYWKFDLAIPITLMLIYWASGQRRRRGTVSLLTVISALVLVDFLLGYRSLAGITMLTGLLVGMRRPTRRREAQRRGLPRSPSFGRVVGVGLVISVAGVAILSLYGAAANSGLLGANERAKFGVQSQGQYGVIVGGRPEIVVAALVIRDSPLLGHGSWAKNPEAEGQIARALAELGYGPQVLQSAGGDDVNISHSHLLGAWVEAGVLGALFWAWMLVQCLWILASRRLLNARLQPLAVFVTLTLTWDILFSPFGAERRLIVPFYVLIWLSALRSRPLQREPTSVPGALNQRRAHNKLQG